MRNLSKKLLAMCMALILCLSLGSVAFADGNSAYAPVAGTSTSMNKYLVYDADTNAPVMTFEYSIAPGTPATGSTDNHQMTYLAGLGQPTVESATFNASSTKYTSVQTADEGSVTLENGEAYSVDSLNIDFSSVEFDEPGVYRYIITETSVGQAGITYDTQAVGGADYTAKQRVLDVYVILTDGHLEIANYVLHEKNDALTIGENAGTADVASNGAKLDDKSVGFVNEYQTYTLKLGEEVGGNQGSKNKYFEFVITFDGAEPGTEYNIDLSNADPTITSNSATDPEYIGKNNPTKVTIGEDGKGTVTAYLKSDQDITIPGIGPGVKYEITQDKEDYKLEGITPTGDDTPTITLGEQKTEDEDGINSDIEIIYRNVRDGIVPTGIMMSVLPGVAILALGMFGLVAVPKKRRAEEA